MPLSPDAEARKKEFERLLKSDQIEYQDTVDSVKIVSYDQFPDDHLNRVNELFLEDHVLHTLSKNPDTGIIDLNSSTIYIDDDIFLNEGAVQLLLKTVKEIENDVIKMEDERDLNLAEEQLNPKELSFQEITNNLKNDKTSLKAIETYYRDQKKSSVEWEGVLNDHNRLQTEVQKTVKMCM